MESFRLDLMCTSQPMQMLTSCSMSQLRAIKKYLDFVNDQNLFCAGNPLHFDHSGHRYLSVGQFFMIYKLEGKLVKIKAIVRRL
jgi:hypothetical protein